LTTKYQKILFFIERNVLRPSLVLVMIDFFKRDSIVLKILIQINEKKTFYTGLFNDANRLNAIDPVAI